MFFHSASLPKYASNRDAKERGYKKMGGGKCRRKRDSNDQFSPTPTLVAYLISGKRPTQFRDNARSLRKEIEMNKRYRRGGQREEKGGIQGWMC